MFTKCSKRSVSKFSLFGFKFKSLIDVLGARFPLDPNREERYGFILQGHSIEERERENRCCHM